MSAQTADFAWDFELRQKSIHQTPSGDVICEGYASTFDLDRTDEYFAPGAFEKGLRRFLATNPQVLWMHDYKVPLGVVEDARLDTKGLWVRCRLDAPTPGTTAADVVRRVVRGSLRAFSVGGRWKREPTPRGVKITEADLMEVSIASVPVNAAALITSVAQKSFDNPRDPNLAQLRETLNRLEREAVALKPTTKAAGHSMTRYATPHDHAHPLDRRAAVVVSPQERRKQLVRHIEDTAHEEAHRPQGVIHEELIEVRLADLYSGGKRRDKLGHVIPGDPYVPEEVPAAISGEAFAALMGVAPQAPVEPSVEMIFAAEAKKQKHEQWKQELRAKFDAALRRTQETDR